MYGTESNNIVLNPTLLHVAMQDIRWASDLRLSGDAMVRALAGATSLTTLNLAHHIMASEKNQLKSIMAGKPDLRTLILTESCGMQGSNLAELQGSPLTDLDISHSRFNGSGLQNLSGIPLAKLSLAFCSCIRDACLAKLRALAPTLTDLNLESCTKISSEGLAHLRGIKLKKLNLRDCQLLQDSDLVYLRGMRFTALDVIGTGFSDKVLKKEGLKGERASMFRV